MSQNWLEFSNSKNKINVNVQKIDDENRSKFFNLHSKIQREKKCYSQWFCRSLKDIFAPINAYTQPAAHMSKHDWVNYKHLHRIWGECQLDDSKPEMIR